MNSRITKFATAAVIMIAVLIGINMLNGTPAWAEVVQKIGLSYNQYHEGLLTAMEEKDLEIVSSNADSLSELWQGIHTLAEAKLDPTIPLKSEDSLNLIMHTFEMYHYNEIDKDVFQNDASLFLNWFSQIEDEAWIYDVIHVSKEMEEYAEEIRDVGRDPELGLSYAEHCLPGFMACSDWFERLPWDNPKQTMMPAVLLEAIERDLVIAHREIDAIERRDADRVAKRCMQQAIRNSMALEKRIRSGQTVNRWKLAHKLNKKINELSGLIAYLTIASGDLALDNQIHNPEAVYQILTTEFGNKDSFADYFTEQVNQALDLCGQLHEGFESMQ